MTIVVVLTHTARRALASIVYRVCWVRDACRGKDVRSFSTINIASHLFKASRTRQRNSRPHGRSTAPGKRRVGQRKNFPRGKMSRHHMLAHTASESFVSSLSCSLPSIENTNNIKRKYRDTLRFPSRAFEAIRDRLLLESSPVPRYEKL